MTTAVGGQCPILLKFALKVTHPPFEHNNFDHRYTMLVLLQPPNFHHHRGWLPPNQHHHHGVLQCSWQSSWALFPKNCPSLLQSCNSHLNVTSFVSPWTHGESATLPAFSAGLLPHLQRELPGQQRRSKHCTLTVATISLSALPAVACSEQLAHSRTARIM